VSVVKNQKINTDFFQNLAKEYSASIDNNEVVDIITFAESNWGLDVELFPMQRFILKCFYGLDLSNNIKIELRDLLNTKTIAEFTEVEMMEYLIEEKRTNIKEYVPGKKYRELILCCGRRGSKSLMTSIIAIYELYRLIKIGNPQEYYGFPSGQDIAISAIASSDEQSSVLFNMIKARGFNCNYLKERVGNNTLNYFNVLTDEDLKKKNNPSLRVLCGSVNSSFLRGPNNILVVMDEVAYMNKTKNAAVDAYNAVSPTVATFMPKKIVAEEGDGRIVLLSSPFSKSDFFYEKYRDSFNAEDTLMFQMYTSMINPRVDSAFLKSQYRKNKESFMREYGAEFSDTISSWVDEEILSRVIIQEKTLNEYEGKKGISYYMGIDFGAKNDGAAISIVHKEDNIICHDYSEVFYGGNSDVWQEKDSFYSYSSSDFASMEMVHIKDFGEVIKKLCERFRIVDGWFDQFNGYGLLEKLKELGLNQFRMVAVSASLNTKIFQLSKNLIESGLIKMINHDVLIPELLLLEENRSSSNVFVKAPNGSGFHDDISDSFVRAVYGCYEENKKEPQKNIIISGGRMGSLSDGLLSTIPNSALTRANRLNPNSIRIGRKF